MILKILFGPPSPENTSKKIGELISRSAFRVFRDREVRKWLEFDELSQQEQDRIFNELVITGYVLAICMTDTLTHFHEADFRDFLKSVKILLESEHQKTMRSLEVGDEFIKLWDELLAMRLNEYRDEYNQYRHELPNVEEDNPWILVTAVGGFDHITRGKGKPEDPMYRQMLKWLIRLSYDINGIYINALKRI